MLPMIAALALGSGLLQNQPKPVLTPEQVHMRLSLAVVFALADGQGKPLVIEGPIAKFGVFTSAKDAEVSLAKLKESKPEIAGRVRVVAITLAQAYGIEESSAGTSTPMLIQFVPNDAELAAAKAELKAQGKDAEKFNSVPTFAPKLKSSGKFLTIDYAGGPVFPFFLSYEDLKPFIERVKKANPTTANDIVVEVSTLEGVVKSIRTSSEETIAQVAFINTSETREYLKKQVDGK